MKGRVAMLGVVALGLLPAPGAAAEREPLSLPASAHRFLSEVGPPVSPAREFRSGFTVEASRGYEVKVATFGDAVVLAVSRGRSKRQFSETAYLARGVATPERLQATFGKFGKVSMRFRESRNRTWRGKRRRCRGAGRFVRRRGVFVGKLLFRGEDGYVAVDARRARGSVVTVAAKCRRPRQRPRTPFAQASSHRSEPGAALLAIARDGVDSTAFLALELRERMLFLTTDEESRGKLSIVRVALVRGTRPFRVNEAATSSRISPPGLFHGTGRYAAAPDGTSTWTGSLSVNFPGAPRFPLAGPRFEVFLEAPF